MKCPHCGQEHSDDSKFCSQTGKPISQLRACINPDCPDFGKHILPLDAKFCRRCGQLLSGDVQEIGENADNGSDGITRYNIILGDTTVAMLQDKYNVSMELEDEDDDLNCYKLSDGIFCLAKAEVAPIVIIAIEDIENNTDILRETLHIQKELTPTELKSFCRKRNWQSKYNDKDDWMVILQTENKRIVLCSFDDGLLTEVYMVYVPPCPHCGEQHLFQIEDIDRVKYGECILRCRNCRRKFNLREALVNLIFCPECGSTDFDDNGSGRMQYTCNKCGHIWGDGKNDEELEYEEGKRQRNQFFPVNGIVLEQSTLEDAERQSYRYSKIEHCDSGLVIAWDNGIQIRKEARCNLFTDIYLTCYDEMPTIWRNRGLEWDLSYEQWIVLFKKLHFRVIQTQSPRISSWEDGKRPDYFDASFVAIANDNSIKFALNFSYGEKGTKASSKSTLYSIKVCSPSYYFDERTNFDNLEYMDECTFGPAEEI